jgi:hypothetical protein
MTGSLVFNRSFSSAISESHVRSRRRGLLKTRNLLIGCAVILVAGCIASVVLAAVMGGILGAIFSPVTESPFRIGQRPLPSGNVVDVLLPLQVGPFTRISITQEPSGGATARYQDGRSLVVVTMMLYNSIDGARQAVAQVRAETESSNSARSYAVGKEPSYAYVPGLGRMAWSRREYFYDVHAADQRDLERFMEKFPY